MTEVNRTCDYCNTDHGSLQIIRFYDYNAIQGYLGNKYPIVSGGTLNFVIMCGQESCLKKAMKIRANKLKMEELK